MRHLLALAAGALLSLSALAQSPFRNAPPPAPVKAELIAASTAAVPGQTLELGVRLLHDPHWHSYWQVPGDSGLPTRIEWKLPAGWSAGAIEWPHPGRMPTGPLVNYGYEGELLLPSAIQVPTSAQPGTRVTLAARVEWLMCEKVCIPGEADLTLTIPVAATASPSPSAALFAKTRSLIPQALKGTSAKAEIDGTRIRLQLTLPAGKPVRSLEFFPLEEGRIEAAAPQAFKNDAGAATLSLTATPPVAKDFSQLRGVLVANGGPAKGGWTGTIEAPIVAAAVTATPTSAAVSAAASTAATAPAAKEAAELAPLAESLPIASVNSTSAPISLLAALGMAFLGGLILNLMPCVFPVLSLKLLHLAEHRRATGPLAPHGLAFTAGVMLTFLALAGALIALQAAGAALGWGFQLQTPWVVGALALLFFAIGLNLLGVFEFTLGTAAANSGAARKLDGHGVRGSFGTGVLAVIVASPCTAPFMGAALGYAITQSAPVALAVFAALGLGMSAPWLLLTLIPGWVKWLPRPGAWMETFKQAMAFPMFIACVWLVWVLAQQVDTNGVALLLLAAVALALAAWGLGRSQRGRRRFVWVAVAGLALALTSFAPLTTGALATRATTSASDGWQAWSPEAVAQASAAGKPVFVDFTAAWCVTCQVNKRVALNQAEVQQAFERAGVVLLRADWTNHDERITRALAEFGRNGVPLYLLYDRQGQSTVLPEILTPATVVTAIRQMH
ncbi:MAG: thioredoxin family protein [Burkholderiaceae bacterium]